MPSDPSELTVEVVNGLLEEYGEHLELNCRQCGLAMKRTRETSESVFFHCKACKLDSWVQNKQDPEIVALCRYHLAAQKPQMTAGEFAGLAIKEIAAARDYWERASLELKPPTSDRCETRRAILDSEAIGTIRKLAAEHNIEIVEPPK